MSLAKLKWQVARLEAARATRDRQQQDLLQPAPVPEEFYAWTVNHLAASFALTPSAFHRWFAERLGAMRVSRATRLNVLAPRGAGKSAWISFAYPLWCALHGLEAYIVLISDTAGQALKFLDAIKQELEDNDSLRRAYPLLARKGPVWRNNEIRLANGVVIEALGTGGKIRGRKNRSRRPSLVIIDDPQNVEHVTSAVLRERSWSWLTKDVLSVGEPSTNFVVLGTALHRECMVCKLQKTAGWESHVFRAVITWPSRVDLWNDWEAILHNWEDDRREEKARAFYEGHKAQMVE